jgi:hypothetical protein
VEVPPPQPWFDPNASVKFGGSSLFAGSIRFKPTEGIFTSVGVDSGLFPAIAFVENTGTANKNVWILESINGQMALSARDDTGGSAKVAWRVSRGSGSNITLIEFGNNVDLASIQVNGGIGTIIGTSGAGSVTHLDLSNAADANFDVIISQVGAATKFVSIGPTVGVQQRVGGNCSSLRLDISNAEAITVNGAVTTGVNGAVITGANTKPGAAGSPGPAKWLPVTFGGTQYYIPMWP